MGKSVWSSLIYGCPHFSCSILNIPMTPLVKHIAYSFLCLVIEYSYYIFVVCYFNYCFNDRDMNDSVNFIV